MFPAYKNANLKTTNPQKYYLKIICNFIYYLGLGNFWYEKTEQTKKQKWLYRIWFCISNTYTFLFIINEYLANTRTDLDGKESNDVVLFTFAHSSISLKIIFSYLQKKRIVIILEKLVEGNRSFVSPKVDKLCVKQFVRLSLAVVVVSYFTLLTSTFDGIMAHTTEGIPIRTEVTFYPTPSNTGPFINILRFIVQLHWWFIVSIMATIDCLCICSLVIVSSKFTTLQVYFSKLREKMVENLGKRRGLDEEFQKDFVVGIKMHEDALWCAKNVQYALGNLYSVQVFESMSLLVMCLIKLVTVERNPIFLLANCMFITCLIILTGAYMMAGGNVTHQASLIHTAMFHSGWELVSDSRARVLVVVALQRSQVPVFMFAFGIMVLSYSNFISVLRSSYSFFAVMY